MDRAREGWRDGGMKRERDTVGRERTHPEE